MSFFRFMASPVGRALRVVLGLVAMAAGMLFVTGSAGMALVVVGLIPFFAGAFDVCLFAPIFHKPLRGSEIRDAR